jgi:predicted aconitase
MLPPSGGVLVTNSGKFAHYTPSTTGYGVMFANLRDCVQSAIDGRFSIGSGAAP